MMVGWKSLVLLGRTDTGSISGSDDEKPISSAARCLRYAWASEVYLIEMGWGDVALPS